MKQTARPPTGTIERPMTTKAAGYSKSLGKDPKDFGSKTKMFFHAKEPTTKEQINRAFEKTIQKLYDESILLKCKGDFHGAKDKCLSAYEKFVDFKSKSTEFPNAELEFGIQLNLALIYEGNKMYDEAKATYQEILQKESHYTAGIMSQRVRINLGNIFYLQGEYGKAITEWKKAFDKIPKENKEIKGAILKNIANAHIKQGSYTDAIDNYSESIKCNQELKTCMNLLLSHLALEEYDKTKHVFSLMLDASQIQEREIDPIEESKQAMDPLREFLIMKKKDNASIIVNIALVMTHYLETNPLVAFDYIIDAVKKNSMPDILNEIEMAKAMYFLKRRDVEKTIAIMKNFENKNKNLISRVSNNISFLYFVEGEFPKAESYANIAIENERYNHKALVNKGNIHYIKEDFLKAKEYYLEAIGVQSDCIEAIYNLGMVNIRMEAFYEAIQAFEKLHSVVPNIPEVLYRIAKLYEFMKQYEEAIKYYSFLLLQLPNDPILLSSLGTLYYQINPKDEKTYMHYFEDSYRYFPSNYDNLTVLGYLYFKDEIFEKAIHFFQLALKVQPNAFPVEIQYAKCFYKLSRFRESFKAFKRLHNKYPEHKEILTFLIANSRELGLPYEEYNIKLSRLDQEQMIMDQGYPANDANGEFYGGNVIQQEFNKDYKGEMIDFREYSNKQNPKPQKQQQNQFMKFNQGQSPDELLP